MKMLSHVDSKGKAKMVDVSEKALTYREAEAYGEVYLSKKTFGLVKKNNIAKGDVIAIARIAGIQAAKKTSNLIPLCHNIFLSNIEIDFEFDSKNYCIQIKSTVSTTAETGVEMEALTAISVSALTIYDMCKAVDKSITISNVCLLSKTGGKSGEYRRK
ncbi:MAG: cyclic pyranopterin monophosphate synthase MoaC [Ignavibacteriae bacterium]|nr:MAG: cyclic pyranopterin monophosphate synthase MoaC [Ignavibacteriota bacterium]